MEINEYRMFYRGELDGDGQACGYGKAVDSENSGHIIIGTWSRNRPHGVCIEMEGGVKMEREWKNGKLHGKSTVYEIDGYD